MAELTGKFTLEDLEAIVAARAAASPDTSYTAKLLADGPMKAAKKLGEEGVEAALAAVATVAVVEAAREVGGLALQARQSLARLTAPGGALSVATSSLNDIALAAARLDGETLPAITGMAASVNEAARGAAMTLRRVDNTPQSLLFGPAPREPGPGEAGFAGFGR